MLGDQLHASRHVIVAFRLLGQLGLLNVFGAFRVLDLLGLLLGLFGLVHGERGEGSTTHTAGLATFTVSALTNNAIRF
ncbi:hypothetical protein, partial [Escherichia coli]|uniref:hypothetical protein n=1 Tax=Escherichia coli TaxID=562 RepID=UPI001BE456A2